MSHQKPKTNKSKIVKNQEQPQLQKLSLEELNGVAGGFDLEDY